MLETLARVVPDPLLDQLRLRIFGFETEFGANRLSSTQGESHEGAQV
jgi:hypothetical protein